jgi:hypothetical protein
MIKLVGMFHSFTVERHKHNGTLSLNFFLGLHIKILRPVN